MKEPLVQPEILSSLISTRQRFIEDKTMFDTQYRILTQYFYQTHKQNAPVGQNKVFQGEFLNDGSITDNVGGFSAKSAASAIMGSIWKGERGTVKIVPPRAVSDTKENKDYYVRISNDFAGYHETKKSRFEVNLKAAMQQNVIYGTTGMAIQRGDYVSPLRYQQKSVLYFYLGYDEDGNVNQIILDRFDTADMLVDKFGEEKVPSTVLNAYRQNDRKTRFVVSEYILPRKNPKAAKGKLSMPYAVHEFMPNDNAYLGEGGYESFPIPILFCDKLEYESYGRSYAMEALPTVMQANVAGEILAEGGEALAKPPLGLYDNGSLTGKVLNLSGGSLSVFNVAGTVPTEKPVFPLYTVGDLRVILEWLEMLYEKVDRYFLLDKFYSLGTDQRKTVPEVSILNAIRADATASLYVEAQKFMVECFERAMDILFSMGLLGVQDPGNLNDPKVKALLANGHTPFKIPDEIWALISKGLNWYEFEFISPAARIMRSEALQAAISYLQLMGELSVQIPEFRDTINVAGTAEKIRQLTSADIVMVNDAKTVQEIQRRRGEMQQQAMMLEARRIQSQTAQSNAQAAAAQTGAQRNVAEMGAGIPSAA